MNDDMERVMLQTETSRGEAEMDVLGMTTLGRVTPAPSRPMHNAMYNTYER